jgi:predicted acyltransferase
MQKTQSNNAIALKGQKSRRLLSLDALRGFDMFWIVSGEGIFHGIAAVIKQKYALTQNTYDYQIAFSGKESVIERVFLTISNQLHHSPWNGFTFYDLIFPLFIYISGISMVFSFSNKLSTAEDRVPVKRKIYRSLIIRTLILLFLGMVVNGLLEFNGYENTRFASVLGRIALSCFFAAIIYLNCPLRKQIFWFLILLLGYWAIMTLVPVPGFGAGVLTPEGNLGAYIDRLLLPGKLHRAVYDPEGLLSTIPAIGSALLGIFTGQFLQKLPDKYSTFKRGVFILIGGILLLVIGKSWNFVFPINKNMWTSSYVMLAGGYSMILFALFYIVIDAWGLKKWSWPFIWMGCNSILIYMAAHGAVDFTYTSRFLFGGIINFSPEIWHSALVWAGAAVIQFVLLYLLYTKKWFLRL